MQNQKGWGNVMYIPAAPWCPRNETYAASIRHAFITGSSPSDFPDENYGRTWTNRVRYDDLNEPGRRGLGLDYPPQLHLAKRRERGHALSRRSRAWPEVGSGAQMS